MDHVLTTLRHYLDRSGFRHLAAIPPFRTRGVYPLHDWYVARRARQGRPLPLAAHSNPISFGCPPLYELFVRHGCVSLDLPQALADAELVRACGEGAWESLYQVTPLGSLAILSSIPNRSPGEFVYLGDDTGMLIEAARGLSGGGRVLDLCCGCGAVGLALPERWTSVVGCDLNADALRLAAWNRRLNAHAVSRPTEFVASDLFESVPGTFDLIIGNPPALPDLSVSASLSARPDLRFAAGGPHPTRLTVAAVEGLQGRLREGGQALFLSFSLGDQLWNDLQPAIPRLFSLSYRIRESFPLRGGSPALHHVWIHVRNDGRGRRIRRGPTLWDRLCRLDWPWSQPGEHPQRQRLTT